MNGYNLGRDWLVERATQGGRWKFYSWKAEVEWRLDLLPEGSDGWYYFYVQLDPF